MNLLIHQAALGDWVLTFPILRALAPQPTWAVTDRSKARLAARLMPHVQARDIEDRAWSALFVEHCSKSGEPAVATPGLRQGLAEARRIISFVSDGRDAWAENVRQLAPRAAIYFVAPRPPDDWPGHVGDWHAHQLRAQGLGLDGLDAHVALPIRLNPAGPVVIHPGSGGRDKCWPAERFEALIQALRKRQIPVLPVLGEVELDTWPAPLLDHWTSRLGATLSNSLDGLADNLEHASLYVGNDSGPTHLAAQMGVPTVALFGPTSVARWQPRGPRVAVLAPARPAAMEWLDAETVLRACIEFLPL